jgi:ArsR family transcriptional regulator
MRETIDIAKALSDPNRVRILIALKGRELCVCQLVELVELAASTVSKHMSVLRQAYLVEYRKDGRWAHYRRVGRDGPKRARAALRWVDSSVEDQKLIRDDSRRLEKILEVSAEELCSTSSRN